eukprot:UN17628
MKSGQESVLAMLSNNVYYPCLLLCYGPVLDLEFFGKLIS